MTNVIIIFSITFISLFSYIFIKRTYAIYHRTEINHSLFVCAKYNHIHEFEYLLNHGADPNAIYVINRSFPTMIFKRFIHILFRKSPYISKRKKSQCILAYLLKNCPSEIDAEVDNTDGCRSGTYNGNIKSRLINALVTHGANVNVDDSTQNSVLSDAVGSGNYEAVRTMLQHNGNVNAQANSGYSLLEIAMKMNDLRMVELIFSYGGDTKGIPVLAVAEHFGDPRIIAFIKSRKSKYHPKFKLNIE